MPAYDDIKRLVSAITALREPFDHHGDIVADLAQSLARAMVMTGHEIEMISIGAHLHDIGKLLVPIGLLNLPRKYTDEERAEIEKHTTLGWKIVHDAGYDPIIQQIVRSHHERLDGTGYPDGLRGEGIPIAAQIVSLCDKYGALTSKRVHRDAFSHNYAMASIQKDKGICFDPELVDVFFAKVKPR